MREVETPLFPVGEVACGRTVPLEVGPPPAMSAQSTAVFAMVESCILLNLCIRKAHGTIAYGDARISLTVTDQADASAGSFMSSAVEQPVIRGAVELPRIPSLLYSVFITLTLLDLEEACPTFSSLYSPSARWHEEGDVLSLISPQRITLLSTRIYSESLRIHELREFSSLPLLPILDDPLSHCIEVAAHVDRKMSVLCGQ